MELLTYLTHREPRQAAERVEQLFALLEQHGDDDMRAAIGRKNYLFFAYPRAGRNIAGLYSLVGSCIANDVEPTAYLSQSYTGIG